MDVITLKSQAREPGKKATKAVRREGNVPCVLYGHGIDPVHFSAPVLSLRDMIYTHETHVVKVKLGRKSWDCVIKDIDFDPVTDRPIHADFQVLIAGERVTLTVPINFLGTPIGQQEGGVTENLMTEITVHCLPKNIPSNIEVDISRLHIGDAIHVRELPQENLEFDAPPEQTVIAVYGRTVHPELELEEEEGAEGAEDLEGGEEAEAEEAD